jgi:uncharacterized alpha-E superfamily protein
LTTATRKCSHCGDRFRREVGIVQGVQAWCSDDHRRARATKAKPKANAKAKAKRKPKSLARLRNDVAELLQKLVRMKAAVRDGACKCVTCGKVDHWKNLQGGHFIERGRNATKILEENIHPQCATCNLWTMKKASGVLDYRRYMVDMYGEKFVAELELRSKKTVKHARAELESLLAEYRRQIVEQEQRLERAA